MTYPAQIKPVNKNIRIFTPSSIHGETVEGYRAAHDDEADMAGVVKDGTFYPTLPLNGHRGRDLAEALFDNRSIDEWHLDRAVVTEAQLIRNLPAFDAYNQRYADSFEGAVLVHVVYVIPGYGAHVTLSQV